jgi:hypothetical protein
VNRAGSQVAIREQEAMSSMSPIVREQREADIWMLTLN